MKKNKLFIYTLIIISFISILLGMTTYRSFILDAIDHKGRIIFEKLFITEEVLLNIEKIKKNYIEDANGNTKIKEYNKELKTITILNYSHLDDSYIYEIALNAEAVIPNITSKTLLIVYPIGKYISSDEPKFNNTRHRGNTYESVVTSDQINQIIRDISSYFDETDCPKLIDTELRLGELVWWMEAGGGNGLNQSVNKCLHYRLATAAIPNYFNIKNFGEAFYIDNLIYHELYHSFQKNNYSNFLDSYPSKLSDEEWYQYKSSQKCKFGNEDYWIIEGAAEYFSHYMTLRDYGMLNSFRSLLLSQKYENEWKSNKFSRENIDYYEKGVVALMLMIEKGWLKEKSLLNGTLFDNCNYSRISKSSKLQFIKDNYYKISIKEGCEANLYAGNCAWDDNLYYFDFSILQE